MTNTLPEVKKSTASSELQIFFKSYLAPALRQYGFAGQRGVYSIPSESYHILLGVQKSKYYNSEFVNITLNMNVIPVDEWEEIKKLRPHFGEFPQANVYYTDVNLGYSGRIWDKYYDRWWDLKVRETDYSVLAHTMMNEIKVNAFPRIEDITGLALTPKL